MRKRLAAMVLVVAMLIPVTALAYEPQVIYTDTSGDVNHYIVHCDSSWSAVAYALGRRPDSFTEEQCRLLSDPRYCPHYCQAAAEFTSGHSEDSLHNITWVPVYLTPTLVVYSASDLYFGTLSDDLETAALDDVLQVLAGNIGGGGTATGLEGTFTLTNHVMNTTSSYSSLYTQVDGVRYYLYNKTNGNIVANYPSGNTLTITMAQSVKETLAEYTSFFIYARPVDSTKIDLRIYYFKPGTFTVTEYEDTNVLWGKVNLAEGADFYTIGNKRVSISPLQVPFSQSINITSVTRSTTTASDLSNACMTYNSAGGNIFFPDGEGPWDGPSGGGDIFHPDVPAPTDTTDPEPDNPSPPTYTTPTIPTPVVVTEPVNTTPTDYTPWLRAIYQELENLRAELSSYMDDIIMMFTKLYDYLDTIIQDMATHCVHLQQRLKDEFENLEDYLYELFQWLSEQMQFNFEGYDDTSLIQWLRKIYSKLGGGSTKPDPIIDPTDFWTWLNNLLGGILEGITSALPTALQGLLSDVSQLSTKFPFSAPWDLFALLALFSASPVTPVFDITLPMLGQNVAFHVDLTGYNGVMAAVRTVEKVVFAAGLVYLTMRMFRTGTLTLGGGND